MDEVQNRIKQALSIRGMKQVELAEKCGISQQKLIHGLIRGGSQNKTHYIRWLRY